MLNQESSASEEERESKERSVEPTRKRPLSLSQKIDIVTFDFGAEMEKS